MSIVFPIDAPFRSRRDAQAFAGVPLEQRLPAGDLVGLFLDAARRHGPARAVRFLPAGLPQDQAEDFSFVQLRGRLASALAVLRGLGVGADDVVAMLTPNHPLAISAVLAAQAAGIVAPVNVYLEAPQIAGLLDAMGAKVLIADGEAARGKLQAVLAACARPPRVLSLSELHQAVADDAPQADIELPGRGAQTVALFHTGGTTGLPKLVPLTGANLAAAALASAFGYGYGPADIVLAAMPMFHVGGLLASTLFPLVCGAGILLAGEQGYRGKGVVAGVWPLAQREGLSVLVGPPTVMAQLAQNVPARGTLPALRLLVNGASALPLAVGRQLADRLRLPLTEPWGLTEATLAVTSMPLQGPRRAGSVGVALPYCSVKAVRVDIDGNELGDCAADEIGVLAIRGPTVFKGYPGLPARQQPWFRDGWLNTGDLGRVDADGYVWITGRAKDLIKRGGHGIDPVVIESALYAHPGVALAAAVGKPDAYAGELPVAYVQLKPGSEVAADTLMELAAAIQERAAIPKDVFVLPAMPLTGVGKIDKQSLRLDAAGRVFRQLIEEQGVPPQSLTLTVQAHARFGTLVTAHVPAQRVAAVRAVLEQFALHSEVHPLSQGDTP